MTHLSIDPAVAHGNGVSGAMPETRPTSPPEVRAAFLLGITIVELQGRVQVAALDPTLGEVRVAPHPEEDDSWPRDSFIPYVDAGSDIAWLTSMWRVNFARLTLLHHQLFPHSTTQDTRYDPGVGIPLYLYPGDLPDYAQIGVAPDPEEAPVLPDFRLREVSRRALNCLTVLYVHAEVSLLPDVVREQQERLVRAVILARAGADPGPASDGRDAERRRDLAISTVSQDLLLYLRSWEGFLRESFYATGATAGSETRLVAFEGGLSMARLGWNITLDTLTGAPTRNRPEQSTDLVSPPSAAESSLPAATPARPSQPANDPAAEAVEAARLTAVWRKVFNDREISRLQHQIAIVGKALDDTATASVDVSSNEARQTTLAVKRSLDYWQRAVVWLQEQGGDHPSRAMGAEDWERLRIALIEQAGIWQALVLGQQDLGTYTAQGVVQRVMQDVAVSFQRLSAGEGLFGAATEVSQLLVTEMKVASEQVQAATGAVEDAINTQVQRFFRLILPALWPMIAVLVLLVVLGIVILLQHASSGQTSSLLADVATPLLGLAGAVGLFVGRRQLAAPAATEVAAAVGPGSTVRAAADQAATGASSALNTAVDEARGLTQRLGSLAGQVGSAVMDDFRRGFEQVRTDLEQLGYAVGLTYPLVEYFVLDRSRGDIQADVDFMDKIVWNSTERRDEITRVASAAFGPVGVFAMAAMPTTHADSGPEPVASRQVTRLARPAPDQAE